MVMRGRSGPLLPMQAGRSFKARPKEPPQNKLWTAVMVIFLLFLLAFGAYQVIRSLLPKEEDISRSGSQQLAELQGALIQVQQMAAPPELPDPRLDQADPSKEQARKLADQAISRSPILSNAEPCDGDDCVASNLQGIVTDPERKKPRLSGGQPGTPRPEGLYTMAALDIKGMNRPLTEFAGSVSLVTNVASQCGYTESNYAGLQKLYDKFHDSGFEVLAFPCNQFNNQEPGTPESIQAFLKEKNITFPIFAKADVNGPNEHPVFKYLKLRTIDPASLQGDGSSDVTWNFNKFLINRRGVPVKRYPSDFEAEALEHDIIQLLVRNELTS